MKIERDCAKNDKQPPETVARLLLSHHPPEHLHRTLTVRVPGCGAVRLCARCCGVLTGLTVGTLLFAAAPASSLPTGRIARVAVVLLCVAPAVVDFQRQLLWGKESNNSRRLITGGLFGLALSLVVAGAVVGTVRPLATFLATFALWGAWFFRHPVRTRKAVEHLTRYAEYYELCRLRDFQSRRRRFLATPNSSLLPQHSALVSRPSALIPRPSPLGP